MLNKSEPALRWAWSLPPSKSPELVLNFNCTLIMCTSLTLLLNPCVFAELPAFDFISEQIVRRLWHVFKFSKIITLWRVEVVSMLCPNQEGKQRLPCLYFLPLYKIKAKYLQWKCTSLVLVTWLRCQSLRCWQLWDLCWVGSVWIGAKMSVMSHKRTAVLLYGINCWDILKRICAAVIHTASKGVLGHISPFIFRSI